jgi:uncharacterized membrane protein YbhN (UPF0104 family)
VDAPDLTAKPASPWRKALGVAVGALILAFLVLYLAREWKKLPAGGVHVDGALFASSTACLLAFFLIQATGWTIIVSGLGPRIPLLAAWRGYFFSQVAKYVPGKVMLPLVRARYCLARGTAVEATLLSIALEMVLMISTGCLAFVASTGAHAARLSRGYLALYSLLVPAALIGIHPRVLAPAVNLGLRLARRAPIRVDLSYGRMIGLLLLFQSCWIAYGLSSYLLCRAIDPSIGPALVVAIGGVFALGWVVGLVSFISPGGLGFREGALLGLLSVLLPGRSALLAVIVLVARLQWTGLEVALAGVLAPLRDRR